MLKWKSLRGYFTVYGGVLQVHDTDYMMSIQLLTFKMVKQRCYKS